MPPGDDGLDDVKEVKEVVVLDVASLVVEVVALLPALRSTLKVEVALPNATLPSVNWATNCQVPT